MIVKYYKDGIWSYIDNVRQVANQSIDGEKLVEAYNKDPRYQDKCCPSNETCDIASYQDGKKLPEEICISNKIFTMATIDLNAVCSEGDYRTNNHIENLIDGFNYTMPAAILVLYLNAHKDYDAFIMVTNQRCFLMNDKGQTIERLV